MMALYPCSSCFWRRFCLFLPLAVCAAHGILPFPWILQDMNQLRASLSFAFSWQFLHTKKGWRFGSLMFHPANLSYITHRIQIWYIQLYLQYHKNRLKITKCREIYHTWILWLTPHLRSTVFCLGHFP